MEWRNLPIIHELTPETSTRFTVRAVWRTAGGVAVSVAEAGKRGSGEETMQ
jgi:hypothetical protein